MAALYFTDDTTHHEFDNTESVMTFLHEREEGELFTRFSGVKIKYNAKTGEVNPVNVESDSPSVVQISYSRDLFLSVITLVADAIHMLAKCDLLLHLLTLNDPELSTIIRKNHFHPESNALINKNHFALNQTIVQILNECEPDHPFFGKSNERTREKQAVYEVLIHPDYALDRLHSRDVVLKAVDEIKKRLS